MAVWSVCERCGKPFSVDAKYCPSCLREKYKAEMLTSRSAPAYPLDMQYCKGGLKVINCQGDVNNPCDKYGYFSCTGEEKDNCPCRNCCAALRLDYVSLSDERREGNRKRIFKMVSDEDITGMKS